MRLNQKQLTSYLNKLINNQQSINNFFFINSEDNFLLNQANKQITGIAKKLGYTEKLVFHLDITSDNWEEIHNNIFTPSLFSDKQIININFINKINPKQKQELLNLSNSLANYNNSNIIIINYPFRLTSTELKQKWLSDIDNNKNSIITTIWGLTTKDYSGWLTEELNKYKIRTKDQIVFNYFCQKTMGNTSIASQCLYKLKLQNINIIDLETISNILLEHANYDIFDLIDAFLLNNNQQIINILKILKNNNTEPLLILWALRKELLIVGELLEDQANNNKNYNNIFKKHRIWQNKINTYKQAINNNIIDLNTIYKSLSKIADLEIAIKTGNKLINIWEELNNILIKQYQNLEQALILHAK